MSSVWSWLEQNSLTVQAIAAAINVLVLALYAWFTWGLWRETKRQALLTREIFRDTHRPWLGIEPKLERDSTVDTEFRRLMHLFLRNGGTAPAITESWHVTVENGGVVVAKESTNRSLFILPGNEQKISLGFPADDSQRFWKLYRLDAMIAYRGPSGDAHSTRLVAGAKIRKTEVLLEDVQHSVT